MKSILILGAGIFQLPAINEAKKLGLKSIVADGNPDAFAASKADEFYPVDLKNADKLLTLAREKEVSGVFTVGTDFSANVSFIAQELGLPGIPYQVALTANDKELQRDLFSYKKIPQPKFQIIYTMGSFPICLPFPMVVKPVDNMGGRGVRRVDDATELYKAIHSAMLFSRCGRVIVEELMYGPEFSIDAIVYKGEVIVTGFADRHIAFPPYFVEMGHTMPSGIDSFYKDQVIKVFTDAVHALGIENGAAKGDMKLTEDGPMVGEIASRLSGGFMSGWTVPYATGVNEIGAAMRIAMGEEPGNLKPNPSILHSAERAFIVAKKGKVKAIHGLDHARRLPGIMEVHSFVKEGDIVDSPVNNVTKCGNVVSWKNTRENAIAAAENAINHIYVQTEEIL